MSGEAFSEGGLSQEEEFECVRSLAVALQTRSTEKELLWKWLDFFRNLWNQLERLEGYEWGRCVRRNVGFVLTVLRDALRNLELGIPKLRPGEVGYVCDSLKCQLKFQEEVCKGGDL